MRLIDRSICVENEFELTTSSDFSAMARTAQRKISRQKKNETFVSILDFCLGVAFLLGPRDPERIDRDVKQREPKEL